MSSKKLGAGVIRTDRLLMDGRTIRYYDTQGQSRTAEDLREVETQPQIGEMRLDTLNNEWVVMAAHRQGRVFLPPKELNPLAPSRPGFLTEIPESDYEVVVFDNRSPSLRSPESSVALPKDIGFETPQFPQLESVRLSALPLIMRPRLKIYRITKYAPYWKHGEIASLNSLKFHISNILLHLKIVAKKLA